MKFVTLGLIAACLAAPAVASEPKGQEFEDSEINGTAERTFAYSWGPDVAAIPELAEVLRAGEEAALAKQVLQNSYDSQAVIGRQCCEARMSDKRGQS